MTACRIAPIAGLVVLAGCSHFQGSTRLDMAPFAENTNSMVGDIQRANLPPSWTYIKAYRELPSVLAARAAYVPVSRLLANVALYSSQVVALVESNQPERVKLQELARYIDEAARPGIREGQVADLAITEEQLDKMLENIRSSRTFLDGLKAAQPLVLATTTYGGRLLDRMDGAVRVAASEVDSAVESRFAPLRENIVEVERIHSRIVHNFNQLYRVRFGEEETLSDLFRANPGLSHLASASRRPTPQELDTIERRLAEDLERVDLIRKQLAPEFETYREYQKELEALRVQTQDIFRLGRTTLVVWSRAHRNLAAGIPVPPDIDMVALFRAAQNAAGKLPVF